MVVELNPNQTRFLGRAACQQRKRVEKSVAARELGTRDCEGAQVR